MLRPEERIAQRRVEKLGLTPPVDIEALVGQLADIEVAYLPASADAIFVEKPIGRTRSLVMIQQSISDTRKRFTLAHEYAHCAIPWHIGTVACHIERVGGVADYYYESMESEANRFASELLMPSRWLNDIIHRNASFHDVFSQTLNAGVSMIAAAIALCKVLPLGYVFAEVDPHLKIINSSRSTDTVASVPERGSILDPDIYIGAGAEYYTFYNNGNSMHWWKFTESPILTLADDRPSSELLKEFLASTELDAADALSLSRSINGVIGAAHGRGTAHTPEQLHSHFLQRFASRENISEYLDNPAFRAYVAKRAQELSSR